jgi:CrcB protein
VEGFLLVCGAGALGSGLRYLVARWLGDAEPGAFPYGTLVVNLVGSFLIAFVLELSLRFASFPANLRLALSTGFIGGLTTYSSFNYQSTAMLLNGDGLRATANVIGTLVGCGVTGLLGLAAARAIPASS